jgi:undecaprenyl-diphosphatase
MDIGQAVLLGIVQGLTEFLPVSSSGHLVLAQHLLNIQIPGIAFEVTTHLGTLLAVFIIFRRDLARLVTATYAAVLSPFSFRRRFQEDPDLRLVVFILLATLPAVIFGLGFKHLLESAFENPREAAIELIITGVVLFFTLWRSRGAKPLAFGNTFLMGVAQAIAILPGISRSGLTIAAGLFAGVKGEEAARFSFLLAIPAILGAAIIEGRNIEGIGLTPGMTWPLVIGTAVSFLFGYLAIAAMMKILRSGKLYWFAPYCILVGIIGLIYL